MHGTVGQAYYTEDLVNMTRHKTWVFRFLSGGDMGHTPMFIDIQVSYSNY